MERSETSSCKGICPCREECPIGKALSMIGGKWKMRILCALSVDGTLRYNDIKNRIPQVTPAVLSAALKELQKDGLIIRTQYEEIPPRVEYSITTHGKDLFPILHRLVHWANNEEFDGDHDLSAS